MLSENAGGDGSDFEEVLGDGKDEKSGGEHENSVTWMGGTEKVKNRTDGGEQKTRMSGRR